jgi:hypothetical protein
MATEFPGNSNSDKGPEKKAPAKPPKKVEKITTGVVVTRKKPLGRKVKEFIVGDDSKSVLQYMIHDVVIPGIRDTVFESVTQGFEKRLYGEVRGGRRRGGSAMGQIFGNATYNAYNRYSASSSTLRPDPRQQGTPNRRGRAQQRDLAEIIFETRVEATEVLDAMIAIMDQYGNVSVPDLWDLIGRTGEPTDEKWGWTDLVGTDIVKVHEGYLLDLPRPSALD